MLDQRGEGCLNTQKQIIIHSFSVNKQVDQEDL